MCRISIPKPFFVSVWKISTFIGHAAGVLLADIGPEQSLNRNSKFVQTLFRVCSYSVHIHTLFRVCAEFVTLCSYFSQPLFHCAQYVQRLFKKTSQPQRPKRLRSAYVRSLFQLKVAFRGVSSGPVACVIAVRALNLNRS